MYFALKHRPEVAVLSGVHLTAASAPGSGSGIGGSNEVTPRSGPVYCEQAGDKENGKTSECDKWELFYNIAQSGHIWPRWEKTQAGRWPPLALHLVPSLAKVSFIVPLCSNTLWSPGMEEMKLARRIAVNFWKNSRLCSAPELLTLSGFSIFFSVWGETCLNCVTQLCSYLTVHPQASHI